MALKIKEDLDEIIISEKGMYIVCTEEGLIQLFILGRNAGYYGCFSSIQLALKEGRKLL